MSTLYRHIRLPAACIVISILMHLLPILTLRLFASYDFGAPVNQASAVMVELADPGGTVSPSPGSAQRSATNKGSTKTAGSSATAGATDNPARVSADIPSDAFPAAGGARSPVPEHDPGATPGDPPAPPARAEPVPLDAERGGGATSVPGRLAAASPSDLRPAAPAAVALPRLRGSDFLAARQEKLGYLVSLHGIPIGSAELEAHNDKGETFITLRVRSNAAISGIFPVNDVVETRHIDGMFIMTKIRQQEGSFRSDEMFTINLGKKRVSWVDFLGNRSAKTSVPTDQVLDTLSGIYFLRNRQLQVGRTETLHIFDGESYAEVPVEVLRREQVRLANLTPVATLLVRPLQLTAGIFRRTGEVLIWLTDDEHRVPVRIVTTIALGRVTAELVSAESRRHEEDRDGPTLPVVSGLAGPSRE